MSDTISRKPSYVSKTAYSAPALPSLSRDDTVGYAYKLARQVLSKITYTDLKRMFPCWSNQRIASVLRLNDQVVNGNWHYLTMKPDHGPYLGSEKRTPCYINRYGLWFYCPHKGIPRGRCYAI